MAIFSDPSGAVAAVVASLCQRAIELGGSPVEAKIYTRRVGGVQFFYFSPKGAQLCAPIYEVFPSEWTEAPNLQDCSLVKS